MPTYKPKDDPARVRNWVNRARLRKDDFLRLSSTEVVGGGVEVIATWDCNEASHVDNDDLAQDIVDAAQDHCDGLARGRGEYLLEVIRREKEGVERSRLQYALRCMSAAIDGLDEAHPDASAAGQIQQQMRHSEVLMRMAVRAPALAIDSLTEALRTAHQRIATLEAERAAMLDREIQMLELAHELDAQQRQLAEWQAEPTKSPVDIMVEESIGQLAPYLPLLLQKVTN